MDCHDFISRCAGGVFAPIPLSRIPLSQIQGKLDTQTWVALIVAGLATAYLMLRSKGKARKDPLSRQENGGASLAQQRAVERQMSNLLVELSEMARAVSAGLDTRAAKLQVLIDEADQRIAELKALGGGAPSRDELAPRALPPQTTMRIVSDVHVDAPRVPEPPSSLPASDVAHEQVYQLADAGRSAPEIALLLARPRGEIELILALRPRRAAEGG